MNSGIYKIVNEIDGKVYVGQSKHIKKRFSYHKRELKQGKHYNQHLQAAANKYGIENFSFNVIEYCPIKDLNKQERYWIAQLHSNDRCYGYNIENGGTNGKIVSLETKKKLHNTFYEEKSPVAKISKDTAKEVVSRLLSGETMQSIANNLGISIKIVEGIRTKKHWKSLTRNIEFSHGSTKYKWVSKVSDCESYRAMVKVNGVKLYDECWNTAYEAAVARELFIRNNNIKATLNFPIDQELNPPIKRRGVTKYIGVTKQSGNYGRWVATVGYKRKRIYVGSYATPREAAIAREKYIDENLPDSKAKRNTL